VFYLVVFVNNDGMHFMGFQLYNCFFLFCVVFQRVLCREFNFCQLLFLSIAFAVVNFFFFAPPRRPVCVSNFESWIK
jgi:hypothetical protein